MRVLIDINANDVSLKQTQMICKQLTDAVEETSGGIAIATCLDRTNEGQFHEEFVNTSTYKSSHHIMKKVHNILVEMCNDQDQEIKQFNLMEVSLRLMGMSER